MMYLSSHDGYMAGKVTLVQIHRTTTLTGHPVQAWNLAGNPKKVQVY